MQFTNQTPEELRAMAARDLQSALGGLNVERFIPWDAIGMQPKEEFTGADFASLSHENRRAVLDKVHDIAMLPVFEGNTPAERMNAHLGIDKGVREAKWKYELALTNSAYGLGYDYADLEILTPLAAQLALVERGATNYHMPTTHKLRHNPMSHSLHVAGLIKEVFDGIAQDNPLLLERDKAELGGMRKQMMRSAIVHDMGELDGELSVAADRAKLSAKQLAAMEHARGDSETEVFTRYLDKRNASLEKMRWPKELLEAKKEKLLNDYSVAEDASQFIGRAHKVCERIQSQQDYLRFSGKSMSPPLSTVMQGTPNRKEFTLNYAKDPFDGASSGQKTGKSLADLIDASPNPALARIVERGVGKVLDGLQKQMTEALQYKPQTFAEKFMEGVRTTSGRSR
ncbi:MAG: hypothetical protein FJX23_04230 [Alphaproteobacteria bacterium]|nr:hypothetical protein [Alphaproteobacteria bacterium]